MGSGLLDIAAFKRQHREFLMYEADIGFVTEPAGQVQTLHQRSPGLLAAPGDPVHRAKDPEHVSPLVVIRLTVEQA